MKNLTPIKAIRLKCLVCNKDLTGRQKKYCSYECLKIFKRNKMRILRNKHKHNYICKCCGEELVLGRKPVSEV